MAELRILEGALKGQTHTLAKPLTRIGRRETGNDWILADPSVSGMHCEIEKTSAGFLVRDIGSTNGTKVNGDAVRERMLCRDDVICAGDVPFAIEGDDVPESANGEPPPPVARTTIVIRPNAATDVPAAFGRKASHNALWIAVIGLLVAICAVLGVLYFTQG